MLFLKLKGVRTWIRNDFNSLGRPNFSATPFPKQTDPDVRFRLKIYLPTIYMPLDVEWWTSSIFDKNSFSWAETVRDNWLIYAKYWVLRQIEIPATGIVYICFRQRSLFGGTFPFSRIYSIWGWASNGRRHITWVSDLGTWISRAHGQNCISESRQPSASAEWGSTWISLGHSRTHFSTDSLPKASTPCSRPNPSWESRAGTQLRTHGWSNTIPRERLCRMYGRGAQLRVAPMSSSLLVCHVWQNAVQTTRRMSYLQEKDIIHLSSILRLMSLST